MGYLRHMHLMAGCAAIALAANVDQGAAALAPTAEEAAADPLAAANAAEGQAGAGDAAAENAGAADNGDGDGDGEGDGAGDGAGDNGGEGGGDGGAGNAGAAEEPKPKRSGKPAKAKDGAKAPDAPLLAAVEPKGPDGHDAHVVAEGRTVVGHDGKKAGEGDTVWLTPSDAKLLKDRGFVVDPEATPRPPKAEGPTFGVAGGGPTVKAG